MRIPLVKCFWCENCQAVIDSAKTCEGCGSSLSIVALSIWMERGGMARALNLAQVTRAVSETFIKPQRLLYPQCDPEAVK